MNNAVQNQTRIQWIDFMKAIAIFAVLVDHTYGVLYTNLKISRASFFLLLFLYLSAESRHILRSCGVRIFLMVRI